MPNLRGASPVGRGDEGSSYAARAVGGEETKVGDVEGAAFGGAVADPSRSHHDVPTEFSDLQFIFREGCREKGRVTRAGSGKDGEIPSARGIPSNFLRDEKRTGRGDGGKEIGTNRWEEWSE